MKESGFYREMQVGGVERPSMVPGLGTIAPDVADAVAGYLKAGNALVAAAGFARDGLSPDRQARVPLGILTDGDWAWPAELAYYVETYALGVDAEFIDHMRSQNWQVPPMDADELTAMLKKQ